MQKIILYDKEKTSVLLVKRKDKTYFELPNKEDLLKLGISVKLNDKPDNVYELTINDRDFTCSYELFKGEMSHDIVNRYVEDGCLFYYFASLKEMNYCLPYSSKLVNIIRDNKCEFLENEKIYIKNSKYVNIFYNETEKSYIDKIVSYIDIKSPQILSFLAISEVKNEDKPQIVLYDSINEFQSVCLNDKDYVNAFFKRTHSINFVHALDFCERSKTKGHINDTFEDFLKVLMHEYTHALHSVVRKEGKMVQDSAKMWFTEGLAMYLSNQFKYEKLSINASLKDIMAYNAKYVNYVTLFIYVLENYGLDYIKELIKDEEKQIDILPVVYEEAKIYFQSVLKQ